MLLGTVRLAIILALKDLKLYFRDRGGMLLGFLLPIALIAVFCGVFGNMGVDDEGGGAMPKQRLRIADLDRSEATRKLIATLKSSKLADVDEGDPSLTRDQIFDAVRTGKEPLAVVMASGFGAKLAAGEMPQVEIIRDPGREMEFQIAQQALFMGFMEAHGDKLGRVMANRGLQSLAGDTGLGADALARAQAIAGTLFDFLDVAFKQPSEVSASANVEGKIKAGSPVAGFAGMGSFLGFKETLVGGEHVAESNRRRIANISHSVAGTSVMMLLFGLVACGGTLLREREGGTLKRLLLSPAPRGAILLGKFLFTVVTGLIQLAVMFAFGALVFGLPLEDHLLGVLLVSVATCAAATSFGVFIATVGRTQKQVEGISTLVILLMSALGGSWFPMMLMPSWMQLAGHFTINAWAMDAYQDLFWRDLPIREVLPEVGVLFLVSAVLSALALMFFRRRFASVEGA